MSYLCFILIQINNPTAIMKATGGKNTKAKVSFFERFPSFIATVLLNDVITCDLAGET